MALELPLGRLQRWMQSIVVHPGTVEEALAAPDTQGELPPSRVGEVILPSRTLTPTERLEIYHGMYPLRMVEALASDYPALQHFLGEAGFRGLVEGYVQMYPSRSYTLVRLGDHLPAYVKDAPGLRRRDFCYDLARLELAVAQVFDAPEAPALTPAAIAAVPPEAWERARLRPVRAFRLLSFRYPANAYLQSVRDDDHDHPRIRIKDTWLALYRNRYVIHRLDLSRVAHDLLRDIVEGTLLGEAIALAVERGGRKAPTPEELFGWFREWVSGGVFQSVELEPAAPAT